MSVAAAVGSTWNEVDFQTSTLTLTGGPATSTAVAMVHIGAGVVNGAGNTVTDAYNAKIDAAPAGTATLTRSWSLGVVGAVQFAKGLVLGTGLAAPGESDLVIANGAVNVSDANSGRLGYQTATQQFFVSMNGAAYVPLLYGPAVGGFTQGSVPFGSATGTLAQDNAQFFWNDTTKSLGIGTAVPGSSLDITQVAAVSGIPHALTVTAGLHSGITAGAEDIDVNFNLSAIRFWATGAIATQRDLVVQARAYAFTGSSTVTTGATVAITNAPQVGANASITNAYALWTQAGATQLDGGSYAPTANNSSQLGMTATFAPTSGTATFEVLNAAYTINQTGGANGTVTGILLNATETSVGGTHNLLDLQIGANSRFKVDRYGSTSINQATVASVAIGPALRIVT